MNIVRRPRRLRNSQAIRDMVHEYDVNLSDLIYPVFVVEGEDVKEEIPSMPGIFHYSHLKNIWRKYGTAVSGVFFFSACQTTRMRWAARPIIKTALSSGQSG